jgi:thioesterase domain-containing protein
MPAHPTAALGRRAALLAVEGVRSNTEWFGLGALSPLLAAAPRGDGHAVLVIPGWFATDTSTVVLRRYLHLLGYQVEGWHRGVNRGATAASVTALREQLRRMAQDSSGPVSIVGWSLGGTFAVELARRNPGNVRQVITLGSPLAWRTPALRRPSSAVDRLVERVPAAGPLPRPWHEAGSLRVPVTAVHSRSDGIVDRRHCLIPPAPRRQNVTVHGSHLGLGHNPAVLYLLADRLAHSPARWRPFAAPRYARALYPLS